jgi:hypothetical protein
MCVEYGGPHREGVVRCFPFKNFVLPEGHARKSAMIDEIQAGGLRVPARNTRLVN